MKKIIKQGAEAILYKEGNTVIKERILKGYRIKQIDDEIRQSRTRREIKCMKEALRSGVNVPRILSSHDYTIVMDFIEGERVKDVLEKDPKLISEEIGKTLAQLHSNNIVHGDPTTSNMIWNNGKLFIVDFGLSEITLNLEGKATDLYVLEEALRAAHYELLEKCWKIIIKSYKQNYEKSDDVLDQLKKIKLRVRYADRGT